MKDRLENLNKEYDSIKNEIDLTRENKIEAVEAKKRDQTIQNKTIEEKIALKKKTINLINDAPLNILKLKVDLVVIFKKILICLF